ncbi:MAG: DNA oxidative demethylase AlkB [Terriglobales bacterium]|jgi:alkylated DNA repair protein (DNA oxidative demethylase)
MNKLMGLFDQAGQMEVGNRALCPGAAMLSGFAQSYESALLTDLAEVATQAPLRHMVTPGGFRMSVAMTNCGTLGWVTDRSGYRYDHIDPESGVAWPGMPESFQALATSAAAAAGFGGFVPDACLINRYEPETKLSLHQDKDEKDFNQPIVSVSLGVSAVFLFGGLSRSDRPERILLEHGDVVVWGGPARLRFHGLLPVKPGFHPLTGRYRFNLTFRKAG